MKIKIPKSMKSQIREERDKTFLEMSKESIRGQEIIKKINSLVVKTEEDEALADRYRDMQRDCLDNWDNLNKKYRAYSEMLKPSCRVTPDTLIIVAGNLAGILLILNFEKLDIVRSKAMSFVLKGRV